ncbi:MAG: type II toxin-antitoxin system HicB family antitoxin [Oscillochloridaceae bacterium umkhey_bin13]
MQLTAVYVQDGKWVVAWLAEWPRVHTQGATIEEARENLRDALELMLETEREKNERQLVGQTVLQREPLVLGV